MLVVALLISPAGPAGCGSRQAGRRAETLVVGVPVAPESPNPYLATSTIGLWLEDLLFLSLAGEQSDFTRHPPRFEPELAERWEVGEGGLEVVFHLDPAARWSDGVPISAADVVFTWEVQTDPAVGWAGLSAKRDLVSVEALDERSVRFRFSHASPYAVMDAVEGPILPSHRLRESPRAEWDRVDWEELLVYSGPFVLARWQPDQAVVLEANPRYLFAGKPRLAALELRVVPDESARAAQLAAGELDLVDDLAPEHHDRACASARVHCERIPDLYYAYIGWNVSRSPFDDVRVRRALALAIDRQAMVDQLLDGAGRPAAGPILSFFWLHDRGVEVVPYDPDKAIALLAEAGFLDRDGDGVRERAGRPLRFELDVNQGSVLRERVAVRVKAELERIGAHADILPLEWSLFRERHRKGDFDAYVSAWVPATRVDLTPLFHSRSIDTSLNYVRLADPLLDSLIDAARVAEDTDSLLEGWRAVERRVAELQPYAFLFEKDRLLAFHRRVRHAGFDLRGPLATVESWRLEGAP